MMVGGVETVVLRHLGGGRGGGAVATLPWWLRHREPRLHIIIIMKLVFTGGNKKT